MRAQSQQTYARASPHKQRSDEGFSLQASQPIKNKLYFGIPSPRIIFLQLACVSHCQPLSALVSPCQPFSAFVSAYQPLPALLSRVGGGGGGEVFKMQRGGPEPGEKGIQNATRRPGAGGERYSKCNEAARSRGEDTREEGGGEGGGGASRKNRTFTRG